MGERLGADQAESDSEMLQLDGLTVGKTVFIEQYRGSVRRNHLSRSPKGRSRNSKKGQTGRLRGQIVTECSKS